MDLEFKGNTISTLGKPLSVGEKFPDFTVLDKDNHEVHLTDLLDKPLLISTVPNIDTRVCSIQTKRFNQEVGTHSGINFVTISTNTIEDQSHWCAAEGVENMKMLSDVNHDFGKKSNLWVKDLDIIARSVWVVDQNQEITYSEIMPVQTDEPDYDQVLDQVNQMN